MDLALITAAVIIGGEFDLFIFVLYYPSLALFAVVFTSLWLSLAWTTMVAVAYSVVRLTAGSGLDFDSGEEQALFARVVAMYAVVAFVSLVARFERLKRQESTAQDLEPDVIVMDVMMPNKDGVDACREINGPAERLGQMLQVKEGALGPVLQKGYVPLLRLPLLHEARPRGLRFAQARRPALRGVGRQQDSLQHPDRRQHSRSGQGRGRSDGWRGR